jgi:DNA-binding response OmpR family regulator
VSLFPCERAAFPPGDEKPYFEDIIIIPGILTQHKVCIRNSNPVLIQMQEKLILIVEDEGVVALSIKAALTKMGYTVVGIAVTGSEAIALATEKKPDVILMDIHIKGDIDGIQTTEKINAIMDVPVIFLTAYADDETVSRAIKTGSHSYLVKPYNPRELYSNIEFAIYKHRMKFRTGSNRERLELVLTKTHEAGLILDMQNSIVFANSASETLLGWTREEMQGKKFFSLINPAVSTATGPPDPAIKGIVNLDAIYYLPPVATVSTKSGRNRTVDLRTGILREESGENRNILIFMQEHAPHL